MSWLDEARHIVRKVIDARTAIGIPVSKVQTGLGPREELTLSHVLEALGQLDECVRYLNTRRSGGSPIKISNEADLQDLIFIMLRPWFEDLVPENPTDKIASRFVVKDFLSKTLNLVIEAKFIRDRKHGRGVSKELHDDIETYRNHPACSHLVFVIYDPGKWIPDIRSLKRQIEVSRVYDGRTLEVRCIVKT